MQPLPPPVPGPLALLDTTEFVRRKKTALWFVGALLAVSASILTVGLAATTRTENVTVGGYYPGIILGFGSFLGIIGINLMENRKQMLVAAIVFVSFGVVAAFCCAVVDGVFAARHIEPRPLMAGRCQFHSSGAGYLHDVHQTEVTCHSPNGGCPLKVKSNTCYCCDLYDCQGTRSPPVYHEFVGVGACRDALQLYWLLWASAVLNVLGLLLGVITAAVLGAFKDAVPLAQLAYGPSMAPRVLYDPAQQILACSGFSPQAPSHPDLLILPAAPPAARWLRGLTWLRPPSARGLTASAELQLPAPPQRPHPPPPRGEAPSLHTVMQRVEMESSSLVCSKQPPPHCGCLLETLLQTPPTDPPADPPWLISAGEARIMRGTPVVRPLRPFPPPPAP